MGWDERNDEYLIEFTEQELAEHDAEIRTEAIDEFWTEFDKQIKSKGKQTHFYTEFLCLGMEIKEKLKENK